MSALNCRTLPKPLSILNYDDITAVVNATYTPLFSISVPGNTAYQFCTITPIIITANTGGATITSVGVRTSFEDNTLIPSGNRLFFVEDNRVNATNDESTMDIKGLIYNTSSEDVIVVFQIFINVSAGTTATNSLGNKVYFWEVPVSGFRILPTFA
jgi:hypothetical protein